jgi:hypothetical protein
MKRILIATAVAVMSIGAASLYATAQGPNIKVDLGPVPISEQQLRDRMATAGFTNVAIKAQTTFEAVAIKDGKRVKLEVDAQSGRISQMSDDDADDDD